MFIETSLEFDANIVEPFISEDMMLQNMDKFRFLAKLHGSFLNMTTASRIL